MTRKFSLIVIIAVLAAGRAPAQENVEPPPFDPANYPPEVRESVRYANEECERDGGRAVKFAADTVRKLDLTGDGRSDYIVNFRDTECVSHEAVYCGTGGCTIEILVTLPNGRIGSVFSDRVGDYEILPRRNPKSHGASTIRFQLHGGYCGGHGNPSCFREHRITATPFEFKMPE
jgi:hypothetical protein